MLWTSPFHCLPPLTVANDRIVREWFGEEYLRLYPHRDDTEAARAVDLIVRTVPFQPGWRVLDVACGAGRHARAFHAAGARCTGVDLSMTLLRLAHQVTTAPLVRADMRQLPIRAGSMDLTVNLFTSFGYFERDAEHTAALDEMIATVRSGGWFVSFLNRRGSSQPVWKRGASEVAGMLVPVSAVCLKSRRAYLLLETSTSRRPGWVDRLCSGSIRV